MTSLPEAVLAPADSPLPTTPQGRRYLVVLGVVAVWMAVGWLLHLNVNAYLLFGLPMLLVFQVLIARRPISELWIRPTARTKFPSWGYPVAVAFMLMPALVLFRSWLHVGWSVRLWCLCAMAGAVPLAFTLTRFNRATLKSLLLCLATGGVLGTLLFVGPALLYHRFDHLSAVKGMIGARTLLMYLPLGFILEEVFFRGGLDSYLHRPGDRHPWLSAAFISVLWGLWHLPISGPRQPMQLLVLAIVYPVTHCLTGIPFSFFWRRSGSLLVPQFVHALVDSVRNLLLH